MVKIKKNEKVVLPPVVGAEEDLGLGTGLDLGLDDAPAENEQEVVTFGSQKEFDKAVAAQVSKVEAELRENSPKHEPVIDVDLTASTGPRSKEGRIAIIIDEVEGMSNSEEVGVNGVVYQIQRGVRTLVPASVVHVLENAIATRTIQTTDRASGELVSTARDYSAIPWRKL